MSVLTITHTPADGTLIDGTAKGDGTGAVLKAQRWRWSRNIGFWYIPQSRDRAPKLAQIRATATALRVAGFAVELDIDASYRTTSEVEADKIARQADRVAALDANADRRAGDAETAWNAERAAYRALPEGGEPIKIGHHSERRHRNAIEKAWNKFGKAVEAEREATAARGRADAASTTTDARYGPITVARRIERLVANMAKLDRSRDGYTRTLFTNQQTGQKQVETHGAATGAYREQLLVEIDHLADEITYWKAVREQQIADGKVTPYSRDVVVKGDHVRHGGSWYEVVRVNVKSVSVMSRVGGDWTDRLAYNTIRGLRTSKSEPVTVVDGQRVVESGVA